MGGDEFVVLSLGTRSDQQAAALVGRLRHALRRPFRVGGASIEIDASVGWAVFPDDGATSDELLARADTQMYATKRDAVDEAILQRRGVDAGVVRDVETALERSELVVVYQPIIDLATGMPHGAEALVRRLLPDRGLLPPADFVPHVERTPVVRELTFLVVADALRSAQLWRDAGHDLRVSVNIPYRLVDDGVFADGLERMLHDANVRPGALTLEVVPAGPGAGSGSTTTCSSDSPNSESGSRSTTAAAASFAALRVLPLDELKIDAGFIHGLGRSATDAALVHGMIQIGTRSASPWLPRASRRGRPGTCSPSGDAITRRASTSRAPQRRQARHLARRRLARSRLDDDLHREREPDRDEHHTEREPKRVLGHTPSCARRSSRPGSPRRGPLRGRPSRLRRRRHASRSRRSREGSRRRGWSPRPCGRPCRPP